MDHLFSSHSKNPISNRMLSQLLHFAFHNRSGSDFPSFRVKQYALELSCEEDHVEQILRDLFRIIRISLYEDFNSKEFIEREISKMFAPKMSMIESNSTLIHSLTEVLMDHLPKWKQACKAQVPCISPYLDVDWHIGLKAASDQVYNMSIPTSVIDIQVLSEKSSDAFPTPETISMELSSDVLQNVLQSMNEIRRHIEALNS